MDSQTLVKKFEEANLELKVSNKPLARGSNNEIVQVDISRKVGGNVREELFQLYPGDGTADIQVLSIDKDLSQLVLLVHEKEKAYSRVVNAKFFSSSTLLFGEKHTVKEGKVTITGKTSGAKVRYLMGRDERQLFIARLPAAITTVKEAHRSLKGAPVVLAEGRVAGRTIRQGEWFFLNATEGEIARIKEALKKNRAVIEHKVAIARDSRGNNLGGKPHIADELVRMPGSVLAHGFAVNPTGDIFVRGKVRHADHETVVFKTWRKVLRNAETGGGNGRWID